MVEHNDSRFIRMIDARAVQQSAIGNHHGSGFCIQVDRRWQLADRFTLAYRIGERHDCRVLAACLQLFHRCQ